MEKICTKCGNLKKQEDFYFKYKKLNIRDNRCIICEKIRRKLPKNEYKVIKTHKKCVRCKNIKEVNNFYLNKHSTDGLKSYCKDCHTQKYDLSLRFHTRMKRRAKVKNIEYNLTRNDYFFPEYCPILEIKLNYYSDKEFNKNSASIDRIDNSKGYVKGNIRIISRLANMMKNSASNEELIKFSKNIIPYLKDNDIV